MMTRVKPRITRAMVIVFVLLTAFSFIAVMARPAYAMDRPATAKRLYQQKRPCPSTKAKTGACPGWVLEYKTPLAEGGDIAPYNLQWVSTKPKPPAPPPVQEVKPALPVIVPPIPPVVVVVPEVMKPAPPTPPWYKFWL